MWIHLLCKQKPTKSPQRVQTLTLSTTDASRTHLEDGGQSFHCAVSRSRRNHQELEFFDIRRQFDHSLKERIRIVNQSHMYQHDRIYWHTMHCKELAILVAYFFPTSPNPATPNKPATRGVPPEAIIPSHMLYYYVSTRQVICHEWTREKDDIALKGSNVVKACGFLSPPLSSSSSTLLVSFCNLLVVHSIPSHSTRQPGYCRSHTSEMCSHCHSNTSRGS